MSLVALSNPVRDDATSIVLFRGPVNVVVQWSVESGPGIVTPYGPSVTDSRGCAMAIYNPNGGGAATAVVRVTHGT
jgi:hypothetical protein